MTDKSYSFEKLTPINSADIFVYEEAIDFVFDNSDIRNVAISGAYCAGKSSVLESYKAKHKKYDFVHICLAHFRTPEQEKMSSEDKDEENPNSKIVHSESLLEGKILNQLLHQYLLKEFLNRILKLKKMLV